MTRQNIKEKSSSSQQMEVKKLHCKRCDYSWYPKIVEGKTQKPGTCARCRSKYWDLPIVRKSVSEARKK